MKLFLALITTALLTVGAHVFGSLTDPAAWLLAAFVLVVLTAGGTRNWRREVSR